VKNKSVTFSTLPIISDKNIKGITMKKSIQRLLIIAFIVQVSACATTPKTEVDHFQDMRKGTVYKTYQKISIKAMQPVVREYGRELAKDNKPQAGEAHVHALLGLIWIASLQPKYALAETEYAIAQASDPRDRYAVLTIQSLAMHEQGWPFLGKQKSVEAKALVQTHGFSNRYNNILALVHVAGSALALQEGNILYVASEVRELGAAVNQPWLVELGDVTEEAYTGTRSKAIAKLEDLKNSPRLSDKEREGVTKVLDAAMTGGNDVGTSVAKAVVSIALDVGIQTNPLTPLVVQKLPEKYRDKLAKYQ